MLGPKDVPGVKFFDEEKLKLIEEVDAGLLKTRLRYEDHIEVILYGEYSKELRDAVANEYKENNWKDVEHHTSSENGERPGLTLFTFYF